MATTHRNHQVWDNIYKSGNQLNKYPFSSVVTFLFRHRPRNKTIEETKVLEVGFGSGNNLWAAAREGFQIYGIENSIEAIEYANEKFSEEGLPAEFKKGNFVDIPFEDNSFDLAIDRAAITHVTKPEAKKSVLELHRVLQEGGLVYSELYSNNSTHTGRLVEEEGMLHEVKGPLAGVGPIAFYSKDDVLNLFPEKQWEVLQLMHVTHSEMLIAPYETYSHWSIIAKAR
jgi:ubiquinone/menaquinone biosynthesis C-methylase UbiE